jgi:hypothetical protein
LRIDMIVRLINMGDQTRSQNRTFVVRYEPAINRWFKRSNRVFAQTLGNARC